jgi:hypothetical protein
MKSSFSESILSLFLLYDGEDTSYMMDMGFHFAVSRVQHSNAEEWKPKTTVKLHA